MKNIWNTFASNVRQILQVLVLCLGIVSPLFVDTQKLFKGYLDANNLSPDNFIWYAALNYGRLAVSFVLFAVLLLAIRKINQDFMMNQKNVYHNYAYIWYWFCSKVLGIRKCNLVLVPIFMQFKLIVRGTFEEYPLNEDEYPSLESEPEPTVEIKNNNNRGNEINLILEDTYLIAFNQIPKSKQDLFTIKVSRNDGKSNGRHFSQKFIETIINELRKLGLTKTINVYATTNPKNTSHIAKRAFALGNRGNIKQLYVFQQNGYGLRKFGNSGHRIY